MKPVSILDIHVTYRDEPYFEKRIIYDEILNPKKGRTETENFISATYPFSTAKRYKGNRLVVQFGGHTYVVRHELQTTLQIEGKFYKLGEEID